MKVSTGKRKTVDPIKELYLDESVFLALTFFPIEDVAELTELRALMSPFMNNVAKCGEYSGNDDDERENIVNELIRTASSTINQELVDRLNQAMIRPENRTLNVEHDRLRAMNIR